MTFVLFTILYILGGIAIPGPVGWDYGKQIRNRSDTQNYYLYAERDANASAWKRKWVGNNNNNNNNNIVDIIYPVAYRWEEGYRGWYYPQDLFTATIHSNLMRFAREKVVSKNFIPILGKSLVRAFIMKLMFTYFYGVRWWCMYAFLIYSYARYAWTPRIDRDTL